MSDSINPLYGTPDREQLAELRGRQRALRPGFIDAISGDALVYSNRRGERYGGSGFRKLAQIMRLAWGADEFLSVLLYRIRTSLQGNRVPLLPRLLYFANAALFGVRIGDHVMIAPGLFIPHGQVVIDGLVRIGKRCTLFPWTTVGLVRGSANGPTIGDGVTIGTGARVLGGVKVGDGASIGANAVVVEDVPAGTTAVGVPAKIVQPKTAATGPGTDTK